MFLIFYYYEQYTGVRISLEYTARNGIARLKKRIHECTHSTSLEDILYYKVVVTKFTLEQSRPWLSLL